jgi:hypothetical protein
VLARVDKRGKFVLYAAAVEFNGGNLNNGVAVFIEASGFNVN